MKNVPPGTVLTVLHGLATTPVAPTIQCLHLLDGCTGKTASADHACAASPLSNYLTTAPILNLVLPDRAQQLIPLAAKLANVLGTPQALGAMSPPPPQALPAGIPDGPSLHPAMAGQQPVAPQIDPTGMAGPDPTGAMPVQSPIMREMPVNPLGGLSHSPAAHLGAQPAPQGLMGSPQSPAEQADDTEEGLTGIMAKGGAVMAPGMGSAFTQLPADQPLSAYGDLPAFRSSFANPLAKSPTQPSLHNLSGGGGSPAHARLQINLETFINPV